MRASIYKGVTILFAALCLGACQSVDEYTGSPVANFEALWKIMDENYCFFDYKNVDWDDVGARYRLAIREDMDEFALFDLLSAMLAELQDGHVNLISPFHISRYAEWFESYPPNFSSALQERYLGTTSEYYLAGSAKYRCLTEDVGYIYYGSFSGSLTEANLSYIFHHFRNCRGLILDVRNNGGGSLAQAELFASCFAFDRTLTGYIVHKSAPPHNAFSEPFPLYLNPSAYARWLRPVILLTNRQCYSAANNFVQSMSCLPQVTILGDRTGGGSGLPFYSELPNGWSIRFSASPLLDARQQHTESGIDPDIFVSQTHEDELKGRDTLIGAALRLLSFP
jgi:hypothetical protein